MALPILETATYELTLPSSDTVVKYRPFIVKEEKILLQALEEGNSKGITTALKYIVNACTYGTVNVEVLPTFDLEYIFLQIRSKSVGEKVKIKVLCPDDKVTYAEHEVDLTKVNVQVDDEHTNTIEVNDKIKMVMTYPTINSVDPTADSKSMKTDKLFEIIGNTIYQIIDGETVHQAKDYTQKELRDFIDSLDSGVFVRLQKFFSTMPRLAHEITVTNPKTKVESKVTLQGLADFFA